MSAQQVEAPPMRVHGFEVPPLSRNQIRALAHGVRDLLGSTDPYFDVVRAIELRLEKLMPGFLFIVLDDDEMDRKHGRGCHAVGYAGPRPKLEVRLSVYLGACEGRGRDRLTLAHEIGHFFMHVQMGMARRPSPAERFRDSEWQADCFGAELLVDSRQVTRGMTVAQIEQRFGVSSDAANYQHGMLVKANLI